MSGDFVDEIDEVLDDWEDSRDAAFWAADGSHEHDPPRWTDAEEVLRAQLAAWVDQVAEQVARNLNRLVGDLESWRPTGLRSGATRSSARAALAEWSRKRHRACERAELRGVVQADVPPEDPRQRALWAKQRRGTGPSGPRLDDRRR